MWKEKAGVQWQNCKMAMCFGRRMGRRRLLQMHSFLVAMDGGEWISEQYRFDIVDKRNATVINEDKALHEEFIDYLWEVRNGDPYRQL